ncbi:MAG: outer rane efflux protein, partial [Acidobacteria bacterium]|nr:outer rane efflux protein [Acidobacteriota bacterium]
MRYAKVLFLFFTSTWVAFGQQPAPGKLVLTLKRAVELALAPEGNSQLQLAEQALMQAKARSGQARAALLPDVSSSLTYRDQTVNLRAYGIGFNLPFEFPRLVGPFGVVDGRVSGSQSIFDFSSIRRFQASRSGISAAEAEVVNMEEQVAARVARAYLLGIRADADVETARSNVTLSEGVLGQAEGQKKAGSGTGIEITRAKVQLANDRQRLLVAENARRSAHLQLLRAMDLQLDYEVELTDRLGYVPVDAITLEQARKQALETRPDLKAQLQHEKSAKLSASAEKYERLPSIGFFGDYGTIGSDIDDTVIPTRTYGVTLRIPIFDGGRM